MTSLTLESPQKTSGHAAPVRVPSPAKARVLHLINGDDYSGAERVQDLLALRLREFGYEPAFGCTKTGRFREARLSQDVPLYELPMRSRCDFRPALDLARLIRDEGYDLLHTHSARAVLLGRPAAAIAGVPMVHHMHCQTSTEVTGRWLSWFNSVLERAALFRVKEVVAVSPTLRDYLRRRRVSENAIALIPNGVPAPDGMPPKLRPDGEWMIGSVAMFRPRKGIEVLLRAVAKLRRSGYAVRMRGVGCFQTPQYEAEVHALVDALGLSDAVDWTGFTRNVPGELQRMDLFVLPSLVPEGMPMAVLEAMAAGVPAVGSRVDGVTDVIQHGENGLLFAAGDADDLARVLQDVIDGKHDWTALRRRGIADHERLYSDVAMAEGIARLYDRILFAPGNRE